MQALPLGETRLGCSSRRVAVPGSMAVLATRYLPSSFRRSARLSPNIISQRVSDLRPGGCNGHPAERGQAALTSDRQIALGTPDPVPV
jgi:hypothetical protein